jgi:hypothetical protein
VLVPAGRCFGSVLGEGVASMSAMRMKSAGLLKSGRGRPASARRSRKSVTRLKLGGEREVAAAMADALEDILRAERSYA